MWFATEDGLNCYDGYEFTVYKQNQTGSGAGTLTHNYITALLTDKIGRIWIGTFQGGLNCLDPSTGQFQSWQQTLNESGSLSNDNIRALYEDQNGSLWIGTDEGLNRWDPINRRFIVERYQRSASNSLTDNQITAITQDKEGNLWVGTRNGLNCRSSKTPGFKHYAIKNHLGGQKSQYITVLYTDQKGALWIGTTSGLYYLSIGNSQTALIVQIEANHTQPHIQAIVEDRRGNLWIGTNQQGIYRISPDRNKTIHIRSNSAEPHTLSHDGICALFIDKCEALWIGTYGGGINKADLKQKPFYHYTANPQKTQGLSHKIVWSFCEAKPGSLWVGTHDGLDLLNRWNGSYQHFRHNPTNLNSLSDNRVRLLMKDRQEFLWIGTNGGGLDRLDLQTFHWEHFKTDASDSGSLSHNEIRSLYQDQSGSIWIGTNGGGLNRLEPNNRTFTRYQTQSSHSSTSISNDYVRTILEDRNGRFWIGTQGGGLNLMDRKTGHFRAFRADPANPQALSNDYIFCIYEDRHGFLWIGTWGGGINRFDPQHETFLTFDVSKGLPGNAIYGILEDPNGLLWISTNHGIARFDPISERVTAFDESDGLQSNEFNGGSYYLSPSGEMFFGGINGFNAFFPEQIQTNRYPPEVIITSFRKMNKIIQLERPISELSHLTLNYKDYFFSFEFAALDFSFPTKNLYAYCLEGLDNEWIYTDSRQRIATYTNLSPGHYLFRVKACNNDGLWNETGTTLSITIIPPFWKTIWAYAAYIFFTISIIISFVRFKLEQTKRKAREHLQSVEFKRKSDELEHARTFQLSMLPEHPPILKNLEIRTFMQTATEVGGDYYDFFNLNAHRVAIVIGDVAGHGMASGLVVAQTKSILTSSLQFLKDNPEPAILLKHVNEIFYFLKIELGICLCIAIFDLETRELQICNSGLPFPYLFSIQSQKISMIESGGPPLGYFEQVNFQSLRVTLHPGEGILFLTDGLAEWMDENDHQFGYDQIAEIIQNHIHYSTSDLIQDLTDAGKEFSGRNIPDDDITLIMIKHSRS